MNARPGAAAKVRTEIDLATRGPDELTWLEGLFSRLHDAHWVSLLQVCRHDSAPSVLSVGVWPPSSTPVNATRALAVRSALSARPVHVGDADPALLAIPLSPPTGQDGVLVLVAGMQSMTAERRKTVAEICFDSRDDDGRDSPCSSWKPKGVG